MSFLNLFKTLFGSKESISCSTEMVLEKINAGEKFTLIDVRESSELKSTGIIPNAIHIPLGELSSRVAEFKDGEQVICYCRSGNRSKMAVAKFQKQNIKALSMDGGITGWKKISGPTEAWE